MLGDFIVPYCNNQAVELKDAILERGALPSGNSGYTFPAYDSDHNLEKLIYISEYNGKKLSDSTILDFSEPNITKIIQARSGEWNAKRWTFYNANLYTLKGDDALITTHFNSFDTKNPMLSSSKSKESGEPMTERDKLGERLNLDSDIQSFWSLFTRIKEREKRHMRISKSTYGNLWEKITMPLSSLVIILCAIPLALTPPRSGANRGFVFSLIALFLFYILRALFVHMGESGLLSFGILPEGIAMMIACWLPVIIIGGIGAGLLARKSRVL